MPWAASPSATARTSSGCSLQKSAIWSNDRPVLSTSQTAVAFGISGCVVIGPPSLCPLCAGRAHHRDDEWESSAYIGRSACDPQSLTHPYGRVTQGNLGLP